MPLKAHFLLYTTHPTLHSPNLCPPNHSSNGGREVGVSEIGEGVGLLLCMGAREASETWGKEKSVPGWKVVLASALSLG